MSTPLPPLARSRVALAMNAPAAEGRLELQVCEECATVQYPAREACGRCLSVQLVWRQQSGEGELMADTTLHQSNEPFFRERLPWRVGLIRLDAGPIAVAHLHAAVPSAPARVRLSARLDKARQAMLFAFPEKDIANMNDDRQLRELSP